MDGTIGRSSSSSSLSDAENAASPDENERVSEAENSPPSALNTSNGSSAGAEYHSVSGNSHPSSSRSYRPNASPSSGSYYSPPYATSESSSGPSPPKYARREGPSTSGGGSYLPRQTESTLNGLYIPSITGESCTLLRNLSKRARVSALGYRLNTSPSQTCQHFREGFPQWNATLF
ncbi:hypothetical protein ElyMa_001076800 [Elysia marginata]|uniref:Uncharacterized protein n=1 Tax=Elysia marginata TaxID=1093978 RepID=A0AAV4HTC6_9GAST|nr:hypothetical protein ElyMa_001076800 [Elysia marginata]